MRVVGVNIPDNKKVEIALSYLYGVGRSLAERILAEAGISLGKRAKDLTAEEWQVIVQRDFPRRRKNSKKITNIHIRTMHIDYKKL